MSSTSKKELIEKAFERMISKDEDQISLAVMDFRKANKCFPMMKRPIE